MKNRKSFQIDNGDGQPFSIQLKAGSRICDTFEALLRGPVPAPAFTRRSDHVFRLRREGVMIETEFRKQHEAEQERYGVYHLKSRVRPLQSEAGK